MGCCWSQECGYCGFCNDNAAESIEMNEVVVDAERASGYREEGGSGTVVNVLSLDGDGLRGAFTVEVLREFERQMGKPLQEVFDLVVGTSAGGLISLAATFTGRNCDGLVGVLEDLGNHICDADWMEKLKNQFGQGSLHDTSKYEELLKSIIGADTMMNEKSAKTNVAVTAVRVDLIPATGLLMKSYNTGQSVNTSVQGLPAWLAGRCTSAVPAVFGNEPIKFKPSNNSPAYTASMADGGFWQLNPVYEAMTEAEALYGPDAKINLVSIGCGDREKKRKPEEGVLIDGMMRDLDAFMMLQLGHRAVQAICRQNPNRSYLRLQGNIPDGSSFDKQFIPTWQEGGRKCVKDNMEKITAFCKKLQARLDAHPQVPRKSLVDIEQPDLDAENEARMLGRKDETSVLLTEDRNSKWQ